MNVPSETQSDDQALEQPDAQSPAGEAGEAQPVDAKVPQFEDQVAAHSNGSNSIHRFLDVKVSVSAELGNVSVPIGELLKLSEGSVLELNRSVSEPVELVAQGVRIARGEVVVIDDCFAIRINEVEGQT